jgi:hypothetical protein
MIGNLVKDSGSLRKKKEATPEFGMASVFLKKVV